VPAGIDDESVLDSLLDPEVVPDPDPVPELLDPVFSVAPPQ